MGNSLRIAAPTRSPAASVTDVVLPPSLVRRRAPGADGPPARGSCRCDRRECRDDVPPVCLERLLLPVCHEVDVELVDSDSLELAQLADAVLGRPDDREAVADLVADELAVRRP